MFNLVVIRVISRWRTVKQIADVQDGGILGIYLAACLWGMGGYPPVGHTSGSIMGYPRAVFILAFLLAVLQGLWWAQRRIQARALGVKLVMVLCFTLFNLGFISLVNGLADFRMPKRQATVVLKKESHSSSKSGLSYLLFVRDWNSPQQRVQLRADRELYHQAAVGGGLEVEIGRGLLGVEWLRAIR
ncbi:hypothetical protein EON80_28500, partial [bacterium]